MTVIDLFCGIGGFSKGFEKAGFKIVLGIDNWGVCLETFEHNHSEAKALMADLTKLDNKFYKKYTNKIDVVIAGPPCQGFSMAGKRDPKDIRNTLFGEVIRAVKNIKPKVAIIENVVGLLSMQTPDGNLVKDLIVEKFREIGYVTEYKILNAADYGVPQARRRVIFIASRIGKIGFPEPTHLQDPSSDLLSSKLNQWVSVGDALGNIPDTDSTKYLTPKTDFQKLMSNGSRKISNHTRPNHNSDVLRRMSHVPAGGNWKDIPPEYYNVGGEHSNNYRRLHPDKPSVTIKHAMKSMIIHPKYTRGITIREAARLQSFYDSFFICGTVSEGHQQLANAVPPLLGFAIAGQIKKGLKHEKK